MALTLSTFSLPSLPMLMDRLPSISGTFIGRDVQPYETWAPCAASIMAGAVGSVATGSLGPLLAGVQLCGVSGVAAQTPLTGDIRVNTYTNLTQNYPSAAYLENGNSVITWESYRQDGDEFGVYAQIIGPDGGPVGSEFQVNTYTASNQGLPDVAYIGNNRFVIVWYSDAQDGDLAGIFYRIFNSNGTPITGELPANTYTTNSQVRPSIASLHNGNFAITWQSLEQDGDSQSVICRLFDNSGTPTSGEVPVNTFTSSFQEVPEIARGPNGTFAITWAGARSGDPQGIAAQFFSETASKIGPELSINVFTNDTQQWPALSYLGSDRLAFAWQSLGNGYYDILQRIFSQNGTAIGPEHIVNTANSTLIKNDPSLADLGSNLFVTVWRSFNPISGYDILGQFFDYEGNRKGLEFTVNEFTNRSQSLPKAVSLGNGTFFVVFQSNFDTPDIYVRFFNTTLLSPLTTGTTGSTGSTGTTATTRALQTTGTTAFVNPTSTTAAPTISAGPPSTKTDLTWLWVVLGVTGGVIVCGGGAFLALRKRQSGSRGTTTSTSSSSGGHYGVVAAVPHKSGSSSQYHNVKKAGSNNNASQSAHYHNVRKPPGNNHAKIIMN